MLANIPVIASYWILKFSVIEGIAEDEIDIGEDKGFACFGLSE